MDVQDIIVYIIIAFALLFIIRYVYKHLTNKDNGCNCHSCPKNGNCKCGDTQK